MNGFLKTENSASWLISPQGLVLSKLFFFAGGGFIMSCQQQTHRWGRDWQRGRLRVVHCGSWGSMADVGWPASTKTWRHCQTDWRCSQTKTYSGMFINYVTPFSRNPIHNTTMPLALCPGATLPPAPSPLTVLHNLWTGLMLICQF